MSESFLFFVGVDLGSTQHHVQVTDQQGRAVQARPVEHGGAAMADFVKWLEQAAPAPAERVAVAIEAPRGALVDLLLERGYAVFSINPKQLDRFRDRFSVAGAKDDRRDALVLASSLRTDSAHFRALHADDPRVVRIRELSRAEQSASQELRRGANQLWSYLQRYFPALLTLASGADELWLWDLLRHCAALPQRAARMRRDTLAALLRHNRIRRFTAEQLGDILRHPLPLAAGVAEALAEQVVLLLPRLQLLHRQRRDLGERIERLIEELTADPDFAEHRSLEILLSLPGVGRVCAAAVLSEALQPLAEKNYPVMRALAGVAPVTQQSGNRKLVSMRLACNHRLREALFHSANVFVQKDDRARECYRSQRARGHSHGRAVRAAADRMLDLLCVMLRHDTTYNRTLRCAAEQAAA